MSNKNYYASKPSSSHGPKLSTNTANKLQANDDKIKELQTKLWDQPFNNFRIKHINRLLLQREKLLLFNHKSWGNVARKTWLTQGYRNTRFFHNRMKKNKNILQYFQTKE